MSTKQEYDFVIVGGGTAGLVLANRLTEDPKTEVLVIEAGANRNNDPRITVPGLATSLFDDPNYDWTVSTVPQEHLNGKRVRHGRGKVLGGSSAINVLALIYPSKASIDAWAKLGNNGWDWKGLESYYRKFHSLNAPSDETKDALSIDYVVDDKPNSAGPVQGSFPEFHSPLGRAWIDAFKSLDLANNGDPLSGRQIGGFTSPSTIKPGVWERSHAGTAYYEPAASRPNLHVITECMVEKLALEKSTSGDVVARGVHVKRDGKAEVIRATKEILLCAGVFQTPQLLELSGIGNPEILQKHGIETMVENKFVGENLQDHPLTGMCYEVVDGFPTIDMIRDPKIVEQAMQTYMTARQGPLTSGFYSHASLPIIEALQEPGRGDFLKLVNHSLSADHNANAPSEALQYACIRHVLEDSNEPSVFMAMGPSQAHFEATTHKDFFAITDPHNFIVMLASIASPLSRGTVHIISNSIDDYPAVDPRYFSHPLDAEILARQLQWIPKLTKTKPLADLLKPDGVTLPRNLDVSTLEASKQHLVGNTVTFNHPCGTCAMMSEELGGVVDDRLKVYGVKGLRVVDASVFPMIPKGNIQSTVYAVAEKAADILKEDHGLQ